MARKGLTDALYVVALGLTVDALFVVALALMLLFGVVLPWYTTERAPAPVAVDVAPAESAASLSDQPTNTEPKAIAQPAESQPPNLAVKYSHVDENGNPLPGTKRYARYSADGDLAWEGDEPEEPNELFDESPLITVRTDASRAEIARAVDGWIRDANIVLASPGDFMTQEESDRAALYDRVLVVDGCSFVGIKLKIPNGRALTPDEESAIDTVSNHFALEFRAFSLKSKVFPDDATSVDDYVRDLQTRRKELLRWLSGQGVSVGFEGGEGLTRRTHAYLSSLKE